MPDPTEAEEATSLEMLADYECPECGSPIENPVRGYPFTEDEALMILGGDDNGFLRCPNDWCEEELELTAEARLDTLKMVAERLPEIGPRIESMVNELVAEIASDA